MVVSIVDGKNMLIPGSVPIVTASAVKILLKNLDYNQLKMQQEVIWINWINWIGIYHQLNGFSGH